MTKATPVHFVVPGSLGQRTGGYIYDRRIVEGLGALGTGTHVHELAGPAPSAGRDAEAQAEQLLARAEDGSIMVIDGLALPAFADPLLDHAARLRPVALIHHPVSLETGVPETRAGALRGEEVRALAQVRRVITTSHHTARSLRGFGVEEGRIGVVVPGTDPATRIEGSGGPPVRLLCVAALVPRKGHAFLLESLGGLWDLDWRLVCAGSLTRDAATAAAIRDLAGRIGLAERIEFLGELEAGPLDEQYRSADILALASFLEGYGMVLAEALKRGLPIATTTVGPIPELVPIEASVQAPPGNVQALTKALRRMIADGELRARMAEAAYQAGQRLPSWEHQVAAFADELSRLT